MSRDENDPTARLPKRIVSVFRNYSPLLDLRVGGRVIRTTRSTRSRSSSEVGWRLSRSALGICFWALRRRTGVEAIEGPPAPEPVYNLEVKSTIRTSWRFSVGFHGSAHNADCPVGAVEALVAEPEAITQSIGDLHLQVSKDAHHVIQDAAVRDLPGYNTNAAPGVASEGPSTSVGTPHYEATLVQRQPGGGTYGAAQIGYEALRAAGYSEGEANQAILEADAYFQSMGSPDYTNPYPWQPTLRTTMSKDVLQSVVRQVMNQLARGRLWRAPSQVRWFAAD